MKIGFLALIVFVMCSMMSFPALADTRCEEKWDGSVECQEINRYGIPTGEGRTRCKETWNGSVLCEELNRYGIPTGEGRTRCEEQWDGAVVCKESRW
jgi:hypothetical protein